MSFNPPRLAAWAVWKSISEERRSRSGRRLEVLHEDVRDGGDVLVEGQQHEAVLSRRGGDPQVVRRNRAPPTAQVIPDGRVPLGGLLVHGDDIDAFRVEEVTEYFAVLRLEGAADESVQQLSEHHGSQEDLGGLPQRLQEALVAPPTFVTLEQLVRYGDVASVLAAADPVHFATEITFAPDGARVFREGTEAGELQDDASRQFPIVVGGEPA